MEGLLPFLYKAIVNYVQAASSATSYMRLPSRGSDSGRLSSSEAGRFFSSSAASTQPSLASPLSPRRRITTEPGCVSLFDDHNDVDRGQRLGLDPRGKLNIT
ncbi:hypothetical protein Cni_G09419 [Canna indica]|uniref:Uncharacterized protein n=1 Tax=Canna indica TaxID=4628 RepID=A0AAQ3Q8V1_9LILI|nr:hypothetical protein Cni_G09419 [Canna indica]